MIRIKNEKDAKNLPHLISFIQSDGDDKTLDFESLSPVERAFIKSVMKEPPKKLTKEDVMYVLTKGGVIEYPDLPPCIIRAAENKDRECLDEILSFFKTYGDELLDGVLWKMGVYNLNNYTVTKEEVRIRIKGLPAFKCPSERPKCLQKYCDLRLCFMFGDPIKKLKRAIEDVMFTPKNTLPPTADVVVKLKTGKVIEVRDHIYYHHNPTPFWSHVAEMILEELNEEIGLVLVSKEEFAGWLHDYALARYVLEHADEFDEMFIEKAKEVLKNVAE